MSESEHTFLICDLVGFTALTDSEGDHARRGSGGRAPAQGPSHCDRAMAPRS